MVMKIAILPSNQHQNTYAGLPGVTEEAWAVKVCQIAAERLRAHGADVEIFHVPGAGDKSTDELAQMVKLAKAWKPDYLLSVHSDAVGDTKQTGVLMIMCRESDLAEGARLGKSIAAHVGLPYKAAWNYARKILYTRELYDAGLKGCLVEVGEHATTAEARWNWEHIEDIGLGIADALAEYLGLTLRDEEEDDMTDKDRGLLEELVTLGKQARVSDVARSHQDEILESLIAGEAPERIAELKAQKAEAVRAERKRLGL